MLSTVEELEKSIFFNKYIKEEWWLCISMLKKKYLKEYKIRKSFNKIKREIVDLAKIITRPHGCYKSKDYLFYYTEKILFEKYNVNKDYNLIKETSFKNSINNKIIKKSKIKEIGYNFDNYTYNSIFQGNFYTSLIWKHRKKEILKRDKHNCLICLKDGIIKEAKTVHHIFSLRCYPEICMDPFNLISLCNECHAKIYKIYPIPLNLVKEKEIILKNIY